MPSEYINSNLENKTNPVLSGIGYMFNPLAQMRQNLFGIFSFKTWVRATSFGNKTGVADFTINPFWASQMVPGWNHMFNYFARNTKNKFLKTAFKSATSNISANRIASNWLTSLLSEDTNSITARKMAQIMISESRKTFNFSFSNAAIDIKKDRIIEAVKKSSLKNKAMSKAIEKNTFIKAASKAASYGVIANAVSSVVVPLGLASVAYDALSLGYKVGKSIYEAANNVNDYLTYQVENMRMLDFNQSLSYGYQSQPAATERQMAIRAIAQTGGRVGSYGFGSEAMRYR